MKIPAIERQEGTAVKHPEGEYGDGRTTKRNDGERTRDDAYKCDRTTSTKDLISEAEKLNLRLRSLLQN